MPVAVRFQTCALAPRCFCVYSQLSPATQRSFSIPNVHSSTLRKPRRVEQRNTRRRSAPTSGGGWRLHKLRPSTAPPKRRSTTCEPNQAFVRRPSEALPKRRQQRRQASAASESSVQPLFVRSRLMERDCWKSNSVCGRRPFRDDGHSAALTGALDAKARRRSLVNLFHIRAPMGPGKILRYGRGLPSHAWRAAWPCAPARGRELAGAAVDTLGRDEERGGAQAGGRGRPKRHNRRRGPATSGEGGQPLRRPCGGQLPPAPERSI